MEKAIYTGLILLLLPFSGLGQETNDEKNFLEKITESLNEALYGDPCEVPSASDYANASGDPGSSQGLAGNIIRFAHKRAKVKIGKYEQCLKQQEAYLRRERLKAEAEVLRAETEAIKAETDLRRKKLEAQTEALKNDAKKLSGDADYQIDLGLVLDFEDTRKLIEQCAVLGRLEVIRDPLESATDLEQLRATLESYGIVEFHDCPSGVSRQRKWDT